jgi:hypothetical protein
MQCAKSTNIKIGNYGAGEKDFWTGYIMGLDRHFIGEERVSNVEHEKWLKYAGYGTQSLCFANL